MMLIFFVNSIHPLGWCWEANSWAKPLVPAELLLLPPTGSVQLTDILLPLTEVPTSVFGDKLRDQVEERLSFYETGEVPRKNLDVMKEAVKEVICLICELPLCAMMSQAFLGTAWFFNVTSWHEMCVCFLHEVHYGVSLFNKQKVQHRNFPHILMSYDKLKRLW